LTVDTVSAVGVAGGFPDLVDVGDQTKVDQAPVTRLFGLLLPPVEGRLGDAQKP
jgi:hypothetical protein